MNMTLPAYQNYSLRQLKLLRFKLKKQNSEKDLIKLINKLIKKKQAEYMIQTEKTFMQKMLKFLEKITK